MPEEIRRRGLGRGLSALMADIEPVEAVRSDATSLPIERIAPNPEQPRRHFDEEQLEDLAASIRARGLIQPLIVRRDPSDGDRYQIVAGERRWRAAQRAQLHDVPVVVREFSDDEVLEVAIVENVQRVDLNPLEEAMGFQQLIDRFSHTQEQVATALGKSRSHIANQLRLLKLPDEVQAMLRDGRLSAGHARALLGAPDPVALAHQVIERDLSVRETERLAKAEKAPAKERQTRAKPEPDADTKVLQDDLAAALGMGVTISHKGDGAGSVAVAYRDLDQLDRLCEALTKAGMDLSAR
ncbi:ParB/RepB/Spo0J family partition protein [Jannaschia sp. W003]|uniref:ParB/RepB/Spo0J family partition protein n=1 Tax=Jannaschia sp. W003 TaxID=2867012 RepID=UPI0021A36C57|nr:ParB/RepB/Spo0J family partition protein [Jannaschia sp. W003]UWQ21994.1 ParB/RepB/Spo0J family partition protein [Jannaschia sp. W003]